MKNPIRRIPSSRFMFLLPLLLGGCKAVVLSPSGDVALQERDLLLIATGLMLLIILPVILLTVLFAWRYRESNGQARYEPDWDHSVQLELLIWAGPLFIIVWLGAITWMGSHLLDPYRAIGRITSGQPVRRATKPLEVDVVALDWKWLFIYPDYGIATVNQLVAPVDRPISFHITASSVMNSFYIPALAGQIYAMPGMETRLHAVINHAGEFKGFSANYSGAGFSGMHFAFNAVSDADFDSWVETGKAEKFELNRARYLELRSPSENEPVRRYGRVEPGLYSAILNMCAEPGKMCMNDMSAIDAKGGLGLAGIYNIFHLQYDRSARSATLGGKQSYVASICSVNTAASAGREAWPFVLPDAAPVAGAHLTPP